MHRKDISLSLICSFFKLITQPEGNGMDINSEATTTTNLFAFLLLYLSETKG